MTVAELKEKLNKFSDDCEVVFKSHYLNIMKLKIFL